VYKMQWSEFFKNRKYRSLDDSAKAKYTKQYRQILEKVGIPTN